MTPKRQAGGGLPLTTEKGDPIPAEWLAMPRSRPEAKALGAKFYFTGKPCKHGHISYRYTAGPCFACVSSASHTSWAAQNREKRREAVNRYGRSERNLERSAQFREANRERLREYHEAWRRGEVGENGADTFRDSKRAYFNAWRSDKMANDPRYKAIKSLRDRLYGALKATGKRKTASLVKLVGCTREELVAHIEAQFEEGMSWTNYNWETWHIDHIRPIATFEDPEDPACWHYSNLRPRWCLENIRAGAGLRRSN